MSRTEFIEMTFPNGVAWRVKAYPIAVERAYFWVEVDEKHPDYESAINDEINYALSSEGFDDLIYFVENLMDWDELDKQQIRTVAIEPDYEGWLGSGEFWKKPVVSND